MDSTPTNNAELKTWLVDLSGNIAISDAGVALLDARVEPENQPSLMEKSAERPGWLRRVVTQFNTGDYLD